MSEMGGSASEKKLPMLCSCDIKIRCMSRGV